MKTAGFLKKGLKKTVLKNGITLIVKEMPDTKVTAVSVWFKTGLVNDPVKELGISHFLEHMLFKTTKTRKVGQISQEIHELGGYINAFTGFDMTSFYVLCPSENTEKTCEILSDAVINPVFLKKEFDKEKKVILEEIKIYEDRPSSFCFDKLMELTFKKEKLRFPISGYAHNVKRITLGSLIKHYKKNYISENSVIVMTGDISFKDAVILSDKFFCFKNKGEIKKEKVLTDPIQNKMRKKTHYGRINNAYIDIAYKIPSIFHKDFPSIELLSMALGDGISSRLTRELKENKKLVSNISASILVEKHSSVLIIEAVTEYEKADKAEKEILKLIDSLKNTITEKEINKVKNIFETDLLFSLESVQGVNKSLGSFEIYGDCKWFLSYLENILNENLVNINSALTKYLKPQRSSVVKYLPEKKKNYACKMQ